MLQRVVYSPYKLTTDLLTTNNLLMERSHSGLVRTLGKRVYRKVSRVRIPLSPPFDLPLQAPNDSLMAGHIS